MFHSKIISSRFLIICYLKNCKKISLYLFLLNSYLKNLISHGIIITDETFYNKRIRFYTLKFLRKKFLITFWISIQYFFNFSV